MVFSNHDAWRRHPTISGLWREPFPGMKKAAIAFSIFCLAEYAWKEATKLQRAPRKIEYEKAH